MVPNVELFKMAADCLDADRQTTMTIQGAAQGIRAAGGVVRVSRSGMGVGR